MRRYDEYKEEAKSLMVGKYGPVITTLLITGFIQGLPTQLSDHYGASYDYDFFTGQWILQEASNQGLASLFSLLASILTALFAYGLAKLYIEIANGGSYSIESVFKRSFSDQPIRSVFYAFISGVFILLWSLLLIIPGIMASYKYAMGPFLLNTEPELSAYDAIGKSKEHMMGYRGQLFLLDLSYLGWYFLGLFTIGILWFWIIPKHHTARTLFFMDRYNELHPAPAPLPQEAMPDFN
jgi:uncharacterized membrane protein